VCSRDCSNLKIVVGFGDQRSARELVMRCLSIGLHSHLSSTSLYLPKGTVSTTNLNSTYSYFSGSLCTISRSFFQSSSSRATPRACEFHLQIPPRLGSRGRIKFGAQRSLSADQRLDKRRAFKTEREPQMIISSVAEKSVCSRVTFSEYPWRLGLD
jgi:hypothetical protein